MLPPHTDLTLSKTTWCIGLVFEPISTPVEIRGSLIVMLRRVTFLYHRSWAPSQLAEGMLGQQIEQPPLSVPRTPLPHKSALLLSVSIC